VKMNRIDILDPVLVSSDGSGWDLFEVETYSFFTDSFELLKCFSWLPSLF
jgi:hypothetical protein